MGELAVFLEGRERFIARLDRYERRLARERQATILAGIRKTTLVADMKAAAPRGATGALANSIRARKGRRNQAVIIGPVGGKRGAFYRHMVIGGTRPHLIPGPLRMGDRWVAGAQHPGTRPNPFVARTIDSHRDEIARTVLEAFGED